MLLSSAFLVPNASQRMDIFEVICPPKIKHLIHSCDATGSLISPDDSSANSSEDGYRGDKIYTPFHVVDLPETVELYESHPSAR